MKISDDYKKSIMLGSAIYTILSMIDEKQHQGKRGRKAILKGVKKFLAIQSKKDKDLYLKLVYDGKNSVDIARDNLVERFGDDAKIIDPGAFIKFAIFRYPELVKDFGIKKEHAEDIGKYYKSSNLMLITIKLVNETVSVMDKMVNSVILSWRQRNLLLYTSGVKKLTEAEKDIVRIKLGESYLPDGNKFFSDKDIDWDILCVNEYARKGVQNSEPFYEVTEKGLEEAKRLLNESEKENIK